MSPSSLLFYSTATPAAYYKSNLSPLYFSLHPYKTKQHRLLFSYLDSRVLSRSPLMENLALVSSKFPIPVGSLDRRRPCPNRAVFCELRRGISDGDSLRTTKSVAEKLEIQSFACISSSTTRQIPVACPPPFIGSPILWVGVGVGLSALFSVVATKLKRQAILHAFKTVMGQDAVQNGEFNTAAFSPGSPFPFPAASPSASISFPQTPAALQSAVKADPATEVEALLSAEVENKTEQVKEATSHEESNTLHLRQTTFASEPPPLTVDAPGTEVEATPPGTPTTQVEAVPPTSFEDN